MVGTKCVRERILQSPDQSGASQESRGGGSDGVNCSRGLDPTVAVASAAPAGESGGGGGGVVSGRQIRWRLFRRVDPAVLYPLVLTLRAQACPAAVASTLPRADLAEVVAAAFLMGRSSGPPHTPPLPQASPADPSAAAAASPLDPVAVAAVAATTLVAPTGDLAKGICLTPPTSPRPDLPLLILSFSAERAGQRAAIKGQLFGTKE
uniref:Uncharacterized protein n=1 Tax=Oryza nivara TaxID=4536 RepID=A0A0E0G3W4_ORYNI